VKGIEICGLESNPSLVFCIRLRCLNNLMFEYNEEINSPKPDREKLAKMEKEIDELRSEIFNYKTK
jgi:hypothetical protein